MLPFATSVISIAGLYLLSKFLIKKEKPTSKVDKAIHLIFNDYKSNFLSNLIRSGMQYAFEIFIWIFLSIREDHTNSKSKETSFLGTCNKAFTYGVLAFISYCIIRSFQLVISSAKLPRHATLLEGIDTSLLLNRLAHPILILKKFIFSFLLVFFYNQPIV